MHEHGNWWKASTILEKFSHAPGGRVVAAGDAIYLHCLIVWAHPMILLLFILAYFAAVLTIATSDSSTPAVPHTAGSTAGSGGAPRLASEQVSAARRPGPTRPLQVTIPAPPPGANSGDVTSCRFAPLPSAERI